LTSPTPHAHLQTAGQSPSSTPPPPPLPPPPPYHLSSTETLLMTALVYNIVVTPRTGIWLRERPPALTRMLKPVAVLPIHPPPPVQPSPNVKAVEEKALKRNQGGEASEGGYSRRRGEGCGGDEERQRGSHDPVSGGSGVRERRLTDKTKRDLSCAPSRLDLSSCLPTPLPHHSPMSHPSLPSTTTLFTPLTRSSTHRTPTLSAILPYFHPPPTTHLLFHPNDPTLEVWTSFSSLSYPLIIALTGWRARGHEKARHRQRLSVRQQQLGQIWECWVFFAELQHS
ncbi:unnamed protein product, partial [Pleuronectes platessa]